MLNEDEKRDFEDFMRNMSKDPVGEYEQDEILESSRKRFSERLRKNPEGKKLYEETVNDKGVKLMFQQLGDFKYGIDITELQEENPIVRLAAKLGIGVDAETIKILVANTMSYTREINSSLMMAFAVANKGKCKNPELQRLLISEFPKVKKHYADNGELSYMAFCTELLICEYFVDEMILKDKVYEEIEQIEKEPLPEK